VAAATAAPLTPLTDDEAAWAASVGRALARRTSLWRALAHHDDAERRPVRLLATPRYDAWVIGWAPGQVVDLHDHGDAAGAVVVTEGLLRELRLTSDGSRVTTDVGPAAELLLPVGTVHAVWNPGPSLTTSIHVYTPALSRMGRYDLSTGRRIGTELIAPDEPALPSAVSALLLHPAG
jgi:predicted metal-dependent enzyme (double-stranded beta helix superfamily)